MSENRRITGEPPEKFGDVNDVSWVSSREVVHSVVLPRPIVHDIQQAVHCRISVLRSRAIPIGCSENHNDCCQPKDVTHKMGTRKMTA